jgi:integrase
MFPKPLIRRGPNFRGKTSGIDAETARWLADLPDDIYCKLVAVELAEPRAETGSGMSIGELCDQYLASRTDVRERTLSVYQQTRRNLVEFLGADKPLVEITPYDAEQWRRYLTEEGLATATARKRTQVAKQFLRSAVKRNAIHSNPFAELKSSAVTNPARQFFVSQTIAEKVLSACPDPEWRLLFSLARYGGVRVPSEALALRWQDVNWAENRILIHARKTERHEGKGERWIPMFPELLAPLRECFEQAEPGSEFVITRYRRSSVNLRTQLGRIVRRAGVSLWPKPWQNCRATRATELCEEYPAHVVAAWLGHSERIAERHYLQTTEEHFRRAAQNPAQHAHEPSTRRSGLAQLSVKNEVKSISLTNGF